MINTKRVEEEEIMTKISVSRSVCDFMMEITNCCE
jgi:hypothetical protein